MRTRKKKLRLFIRRTIVCLCGAGIIYLVCLGVTAIFQEISTQIGLKNIPQVYPSSELVSSSAVAAVPRVLDPPPDVKPVQTTPDSFDGALFVGDSRTEGLENYNGLQGAQYYAVKGLMVNTVYTRPAVNSDGEKVTVMQAIKKKQFSSIYIMLGVNELGWSSTQKFVEDYTKMIEDIRTYQPQAKIYLQSILPVSEKKSESDKIYNIDKIASYNREIEKIAQKQNVYYLSVDAAISNSQGFLPEEASGDGIHLNRKYIKIWCDYLRAHA